MDRVQLEGMVFNGRHGVTAAERARTQPFTVDVELEVNAARAGRSDRIEDTVDYRKVHAEKWSAPAADAPEISGRDS